MLYLPREEGQGLVEYALILVLVAIVVIVILTVLGPIIGNVFSTIGGALTSLILRSLFERGAHRKVGASRLYVQRVRQLV
jgi:pilus assembly protein Flp/PilA